MILAGQREGWIIDGASRVQAERDGAALVVTPTGPLLGAEIASVDLT
jgi:hypothetical protein